MKHTKTTDVPATTKTVVDRITCDLCGKAIPDTGYDVDEVTVQP